MSNPEQKAKRTTSLHDDTFWLTDLYPDAAALFSHRQAGLDDISADCIVVLDANVLLWPFELEAAPVEDIAKLYKTLAGQGRLIVPGQAAREYYKHRSRKVAALTEVLEGAVSRAQKPPLDKPIPLLGNDADYKAAWEINAQIVNLGKAMAKHLRAASEKLKGEIGSDRVSRIYAGVLAGCVVDLDQGPEARAAIVAEAERRARLYIAPGYKDQAKEDGGIGDLMIWMTALKEGKARKRHCIFVTNEQKSDWWVKSRGTFQPRPELIEEYRQHSGGKSVHFLPLSGLLTSFKAAADTIEAVQKLEESRRALWAPIAFKHLDFPGEQRVMLENLRHQKAEILARVAEIDERLERHNGWMQENDRAAISETSLREVTKMREERSTLRSRSQEIDNAIEKISTGDLFSDVFSSLLKLETTP